MYKMEKADQYFQEMKTVLPGGVHYNFRLPWEERPIPFVKGNGARVWDLDGNEYLDFYAKFGAMFLGHNHPKYNGVLKEWIDRISAVNHCDLDAEVSQMIIDLIPSAEMVRFGLSGTEILQNALRLARAYTKKNKFVRFIGHYNGNADNVLGGKMKSLDNPIPVDFKGDTKGTDGRADQIMENQTYLIPWNDVEALTNLLVNHHEEIAALLMEPICINGGGIMPKPGYLEKARELCDQYNVVLIFDEIITGFRLGLSGAQGYLGVTPDLSTFGKAIAGGTVPVSVLAGKEKIMKLLAEKKVIHAGTFNGYPLGMAAIKATIQVLKEKDVYDNMTMHMNQMHQILLAEAKKLDMAMIIQGPVTCASYHCTDKVIEDVTQWDMNTMFKDAMVNSELTKVGILISTVSRMYPNISITAEDVEFFKERVPQGLLQAKKIFDEVYGNVS